VPTTVPKHILRCTPPTALINSTKVLIFANNTYLKSKHKQLGPRPCPCAKCDTIEQHFQEQEQESKSQQEQEQEQNNQRTPPTALLAPLTSGPGIRGLVEKSFCSWSTVYLRWPLFDRELLYVNDDSENCH
jgi:hypothetical protein